MNVRKVVLDTNILVSAVMSPDNACRAILRMVFSGHIQPLVGNALFLEYESVYGRDEIFEKAPWGAEKRAMFLDDFLSTCKWVDIHYLWRPNLRDEGDNHVLELVLAGGADILVTQNIRDFNNADMRLGNFKILHPHEFLRYEREKQWQQ